MTMQEYRRLSELGDRIKANLASKADKDEYMQLLLKNGSITQAQYQNYMDQKGSKQADDLVGAALAVGAILLIGYLIKELGKTQN